MTEHADQETEHHLREAIRHLSEAQDGDLRKTHDVAIEEVLTTVSTVLHEHSQDE
ncbi:hypothetical protein [Natronorubrum daqingense]|uniref:Uncharacterized protein n=1 Tax=Natronorubrum daqingense TaxID=588898 RepID=A0A1N6Y913_9EURY|nr:hypothetical protein [Natronorubrum daqingense]SIR11044.1 hypothetical protein SAMN05421809_0362 [Natronorubrum daqingense]